MRSVLELASSYKVEAREELVVTGVELMNTFSVYQGIKCSGKPP